MESWPAEANANWRQPALPSPSLPESPAALPLMLQRRQLAGIHCRQSEMSLAAGVMEAEGSSSWARSYKYPAVSLSLPWESP